MDLRGRQFIYGKRSQWLEMECERERERDEPRNPKSHIYTSRNRLWTLMDKWASCFPEADLLRRPCLKMTLTFRDEYLKRYASINLFPQAELSP